MNPYRLKHVPSGLYYQPHKHRGSNLSTRGKIYQTKNHGLSSAFKYSELYSDDRKYSTFRVITPENSQIHKKYENVFDWQKSTWSYKEMTAVTKLSDWVIEEIKLENN